MNFSVFPFGEKQYYGRDFVSNEEGGFAEESEVCESLEEPKVQCTV